jgi:predicted outer membrane repeat protein
MYNSLVALPITNCTFSGNTATASGGGMFNTGKLPIIDNNYFCGNTPEYIYGPHTDEGTNTFYTYCPPPQPIVEGDLTGDGKVDMLDLAELAANWLAGT